MAQDKAPLSDVLNEAAQRQEEGVLLRRMLSDGIPSYVQCPTFLRADVDKLLADFEHGDHWTVVRYADDFLQEMLEQSLDNVSSGIDNFEEWKSQALSADPEKAAAMLLAGLKTHAYGVPEKEARDTAQMKTGIAHIIAGTAYLETLKEQGRDDHVYVMARKLAGLSACMEDMHKTHQEAVQRIARYEHLARLKLI